MCQESCYGALSCDGSSPGLQVTETNINEGEVKGGVAVHHFLEELHGQWDQEDHGVFTATCEVNIQKVTLCTLCINKSGCQIIKAKIKQTTKNIRKATFIHQIRFNKFLN